MGKREATFLYLVQLGLMFWLGVHHGDVIATRTDVALVGICVLVGNQAARDIWTARTIEKVERAIKERENV